MVLRILKYLSRLEKTMIVGVLLTTMAQVWLELKMPDYMSEITRLVQTSGSLMRDIWYAGGMMLLCALGSMIATMCSGFLCARIAAGYSMRLREMVFRKTQTFSMEELNRFSVASLITRSTNDVTQVQSLVAMGMQMLLKAPLTAVWALIKISSKQQEWTITAWVCVAILLVMNGVLIALTEPKFRSMQTLTDQLNRVTREHLTGLRVVRAYNAEPYQEQKFAEANDALTKTGLFTGRLMAAMDPGFMLIMNGMNMVIYLLGAYILNAADIAVRPALYGEMVAFSSYAMQIIMSFDMLIFIFLMAPRALVSARRILEVIETVPTIQDGPGAAETAKGTVAFENVSFRYPGAADDVLSGISFTVNSGETTAIIGATGSGKTSIVNLILRFYDASGGRILVDGADVRDYPQNVLRKKIGFVPQKTVLFSGTVESNVSSFADGSAETVQRVKEAVTIAQGAEFVDSLPQQYQSEIAQGGSNLSGGQKQRLAIARAVYQKPEILIFDDSFSALDYRTDRDLRAALKTHTAGTTCIMVAQRIGTILDADRIIVLDQGQIVGMGTHRELLKTCPVYQQIAKSQLSEEELSHV